MLHDRTASVLSLARTVRAGLDSRDVESKVTTATLILLLDTLIDLGVSAGSVKVAESANRTVMGQMSSMTMHGGRNG